MFYNEQEKVRTGGDGKTFALTANSPATWPLYCYKLLSHFFVHWGQHLATLSSHALLAQNLLVIFVAALKLSASTIPAAAPCPPNTLPVPNLNTKPS
jgi:hypothetical protein